MKTPKIELLEQLDNCVDILLSYIHNDEMRYNVKQKVLTEESGWRHFDSSKKLAENGYEVNDNDIVTIYYNKTGKVRFDFTKLPFMIETVKKDFPDKEVKMEKTTFRLTPYRPKSAYDTVSQRKSLEESEHALEVAQNNVKQAIQSGNKGLVTVFNKQLETELECMTHAKKIDYSFKALQNEFKESGYEKQFYNDFCNGESKTNYYAIGFTPITAYDYKLLKEKDMLSPDMTYNEAAIVCDFYKHGVTMDDYERLQLSNFCKYEIELKAKFGRKNGDGYVKPKNNTETYNFNRLQNLMARSKFILDTLKYIFAEEEVTNMVY